MNKYKIIFTQRDGSKFRFVGVGKPRQTAEEYVIDCPMEDGSQIVVRKEDVRFFKVKPYKQG